MAGRTLVVMEGGHPWGFRIEGGAEVRAPIRINTVLGGGKAYSHGIKVGDVLSSINGETASKMTISRARHLIRTSDDLLVLEVTRPYGDRPQIPEIRVISPNENRIIGTNLSWGANGVSESEMNVAQRNIANTAMDMFGPRSPTTLVRSPRPMVPRPVPPPKPPLVTRNTVMAQKQDDNHKSVKFNYPVSPSSPVMLLHGRDPGVLTLPGGNMSEVYGRTAAGQSLPAAWQSSGSPGNRRPQAPKKPDNLRSGVSAQNANMNSGFSSQIRNTEPAPIKPGGYGTLQYTDKGADYDDQWLRLKKAEPVDVRQFRYGTTDAGPMSMGITSAPVSLPLSPTRKPVSENQFDTVDLFIKEDPYDLLPARQGKVLPFKGQTKHVIHHPNMFKTEETEILRASMPLRNNWPRKFEMPEAGYDTSVSRVESDMYPDYEFLPLKSTHQENKILSPRYDGVQREQFTAKERISFPGPPFQRVTMRQKLDAENLRRKLEIERVIAEEKRRRILKDQMANSARRHSDNFSPVQRRSLLLDRFSDDEVAEALARPIRRVYTKIRGKARALYTFRAQNNRELSFKRNDIVYILCQIDKNWYEGERHGMVGIFPVTYVEVITSLDEAKATAILREGTATAIYNFKAQTETELQLKKGDLVTLIRRVDQNWYEGRTGRRQGIFPVTYVETHREPDTPMVTPMSSLANTPVPGTPTCQSPVSSVYSAGPEIPSAPMSPLDSEFYESDWDAESLGALQSGRPLRTSRPTSPTYSDREITPVRAVTSPIPTGAAFRAVTSPPPGYAPMRTIMSTVHSGADVWSVTSPVLVGAPAKTIISSASSAKPARTVLSPVPSDAPNRAVTSPVPSVVPSRTVTSPVPYGAGYSHVWGVEGSKVQKPAVTPKLLTLPANQNQKKEVRIDAVPSNKEIDKRFSNVEQHQPTKFSTAANDATLTKSDAAKQRPPSGRMASLTLKTSKQRSGTKQTPTDAGDKRGGFSRTARSQNPYMRYRAIYNYKPQNIDELELTRGDIVFVMEKCADGWCVGISDKTKQFGTFPANFVRPL